MNFINQLETINNLNSEINRFKDANKKQLKLIEQYKTGLSDIE
jgi:hypothetical protein